MMWLPEGTKRVVQQFSTGTTQARWQKKWNWVVIELIYKLAQVHGFRPNFGLFLGFMKTHVV